MTTQKPRDLTIDIIKGIGIVLMVVGHAGSPFMGFIYSFHMPLFFIASGYLFNKKYSQGIKSIKEYTVKKIKGLYLPYCIWTVIFVLCNNLFIKLNILTNNENLLQVSASNTIHQIMPIKEQAVEIGKAILFLGGTQMTGAFWFFRTLFFVSILYCVIQFFIDKVLKQSKNSVYIQLAIAVLFCVVEQVLILTGIIFAGVHYIFAYYIMFYIGHMFKVLSLRKYAENWTVAIISAVVLVSINLIQGTHSFNQPTIYAFKFITSCTGWIVVWNIASAIDRVAKANKCFAHIGQSTASIVILHFLALKSVSFLQVMIYSRPMYEIASYPVLSGDNGWWILYTFAGVALPLLLNSIYKVAKRKILKTKTAGI